MALERTLSIIKPDAVAKNVIGEIYSRFEKAGLKVVAAKMKHLSRREAEGFIGRKGRRQGRAQGRRCRGVEKPAARGRRRSHSGGQAEDLVGRQGRSAQGAQGRDRQGQQGGPDPGPELLNRLGVNCLEATRIRLGSALEHHRLPA